MAINNNGFLSWIPKETGKFHVKVIVTDGRWGMDAQTYYITVLKQEKQPEESFAVGDLLITKLIIHNEYAKPGDTIEISMNLENTGKTRLENIRISASIQEFAERSREGPFDIGKRDQITKNLFIQIPEDVPSGEFYIRFSFSDGTIRRVKYRPITII